MEDSNRILNAGGAGFTGSQRDERNESRLVAFDDERRGGGALAAGALARCASGFGAALEGGEQRTVEVALLIESICQAGGRAQERAACGS